MTVANGDLEGRCNTASCPDGFYENPDVPLTCLNCDPACATCDAGTAYDCGSCATGFYEANVTVDGDDVTICTNLCPSGQFVCTSACESDCIDCNAQCSECSQSADSCIECGVTEYPVYYSDASVTCIDSCPNGTFNYHNYWSSNNWARPDQTDDD